MLGEGCSSHVTTGPLKNEKHTDVDHLIILKGKQTYVGAHKITEPKRLIFLFKICFSLESYRQQLRKGKAV